MPSQTSSVDAIPSDVLEGTASMLTHMSKSSKDTSKKDNGMFEFSPSPKPFYRVSYEKHPYTIGLSMFDDDSDFESDNDDDDDDDDGSDNARGTTAFRCQDPLVFILEKAQAATFSEITTRTTLHLHGSHYKTPATKSLPTFASLKENILGPTLPKQLLLSQAQEASTRSCQKGSVGTPDEK